MLQNAPNKFVQSGRKGVSHESEAYTELHRKCRWPPVPEPRDVGTKGAQIIVNGAAIPERYCRRQRCGYLAHALPRNPIRMTLRERREDA